MFMKGPRKNEGALAFRWSRCLGLLCFSVVSDLIGRPVSALAQAAKDPTISLQVSGLDATEPWTFGLRILFMLTVLTLAPALLMLVTSFTRVVIVLGLLRQALGTLHAPPNQVMIGLALFLTLFIMMPVWEQVRTEALNPIREGDAPLETWFDLMESCQAALDRYEAGGEVLRAAISRLIVVLERIQGQEAIEDAYAERH